MAIRAGELTRLVLALTGVAAVTAVYAGWLGVTNAATVSVTYLLVVLVVATTSSLWIAVTTSVAAMLCFNFFFLPPVTTFTIADPHNWVALFAFLAVSLVASRLSVLARAKTDEATHRRNELARLFDLSRDVLMLSDRQTALTELSRSIARRFDLAFVAIAVPGGAAWEVSSGGASRLALEPRELTHAFAIAQASYEFDARARTYAGHRSIDVDGQSVRLVPLRVGTKPIGLLAVAGRPVEGGTLDTLGGVAAIAIERTQFLAERNVAALTRQSEELKTALLASLGHDLRTPLTAIQVAATNLDAPDLATEARHEQSQVILAEVERLSRLFQNVLEMARIDAGAVNASPQRAHPSEIVAAARSQVEHALRGHPVTVDVGDDAAVVVDPRLTASALAHVLENAAQYSPAGAPIAVRASAAASGLLVEVRDRGPGLPPADLPRVFDRFYRGAAGQGRTSGTGMGLWIARELAAAEDGQIWAENAPDGGTVVSLRVPITVATSSAGAPS